jgi:hypothetical protein
MVPHRYTFSSTASDTSTDGATNFAARFGADWTQLIFHACVVDAASDAQVQCEHGNTGGNVIYDGGSDMYDIGNLIMTSLMDPHGDQDVVWSANTPAAECPIGALIYEADFSPVPTTCFGPGGYYEMNELAGVWVFFSQNFQAEEPLSFGVVGNLGHDGSGVVNAFEFTSGPWKGFVKSTCEAAVSDPSVNHLIVVDSGASSGFVPSQSCAGVPCQGSDTNLDDHEVTNIGPGSTIMYIIYGVENLGGGNGGRPGADDEMVNNCMTRPQHQALFEAAISCIYEEAARAAGTHCEYEAWAASIQALVPHRYEFSSASSDTSHDGADALTLLYGASWSQYIYHACVTGEAADDMAECEHGNTGGNCIYDGGGDMYDIGNIIVSNLMATPNPELQPAVGAGSPAAGCMLGNIRYEENFEPIQTTCFGPGGYYEMAETSGAWIFFTQNFQADAPLTFGVIGNLGTDGQVEGEYAYSVQSWELASAPWKAFVKSTCQDHSHDWMVTNGIHEDPSINHMIIVPDLAGDAYTPRHTCKGLPCTSSSPNLDDHEVSDIAPGSTILYLMYATEIGYCVTEADHEAIFGAAVSCIVSESARAASTHCQYTEWSSSIRDLVPNHYLLSQAESLTSNDGSGYLSELFGQDWNAYVFHDCVVDTGDAQAACEHGNTGGNTIFDGGADMYDIGNVIMTSLMGTPTGGQIGCDLGAIRYEADFTPIVSTCFGPGGYYEMGEIDGLWLFFAQNFLADDPLDFGVIGNLGADGSGHVTAHVFDHRPWKGFVKSVCEAKRGISEGICTATDAIGCADDPTVNHLIIVDSGESSGFTPSHYCRVGSCDDTLATLSDRVDPIPGPRGGVDSGPCEGSCSNYDDDWVTNIAPGSTILYLVYATADTTVDPVVSLCPSEAQHRAIFEAALTCIFEEGARAAGDHCDYDAWTTSLQQLVPDIYAFSSASSDTSTDGATHFNDMYGERWTDYIFHSCVTGATADAQVQCEHGNTAGNVIYDGGSDMYDIGNLITTNLMGNPGGGVPGCEDIGAIVYEKDFVPIQTTCFGPGGYYQMDELDGLWVFFSQNFLASNTLTMAIKGNLGHDGSGHVNSYEFTARPWKGFVKQTCEGDGTDPSVNHMWIVDGGFSSGNHPRHTCSGGMCTGSDTNTDNDEVSGIAPGSTIVYMVYGTENLDSHSNCVPERTHRAIFDVALQCIAAESIRAVGSHCDYEPWSQSIHDALPSMYAFSSMGSDSSGDGINDLRDRFSRHWDRYIYHACLEEGGRCEHSNAAGNCIYDGGADMYDLGNILVTSLMDQIGDPDVTDTVAECPLGAIGYENNFEPIPSTCFGPGGYYEMAELEGVWVFLSQNFQAEDPINFGVIGNLGADDLGSVNEFEFNARPWKGFVKQICDSGNTHDTAISDFDPAVNHLIVVDAGESSGFVPSHSCGEVDLFFEDPSRGGGPAACQGSDPNKDDDYVTNIGPGSTILYLVYASVDGYCATETEHQLVFDAAIACIFAEGAKAAGEHCEYDAWSTSIQALVPESYSFSAAASDTSTDGANNFAARFGANWNQYIYHACVTGSTADDQAACEHSNAAGNCIYDGGADMYDIGNVITTSLMGMPTGGAPGCDLGSIRYETNYAPIQSTCFGPGGYYQMNEMEGLWIFFTQNFQTADPLSFRIMGNLGADGSGSVHEYTFNSRPFVGYVKSVCETTGDPSINHLIVVDGGLTTGYRPRHSCYAEPVAPSTTYTATPCEGSNSNFDDDEVSNIGPGSPLLYIVYSTVGDTECISRDEHRAIFLAAITCLG